MNKKKNNTSVSDSWLLFSVVLASQKKPADLESIIAIGDGINHAIFTFEEMRNGIERLIMAGYVQETENRYRATEVALAQYRAICKKAKSLYEQLELLSSNFDVTQVDKVKSRPLKLSVKSFREALDSYLKKASPSVSK